MQPPLIDAFCLSVAVLALSHTVKGGGTILLQGFDIDDLDASDFLFRVNQTLEGNEDNNFLYGDTGDDTFYGNAGNDKMWGYAGNDTLYGDHKPPTTWTDGGADTLDGGAGDDVMWGGAGDDEFVFQGGHGNDTIKDFTDGEDLIDLTQISGISGFDDLTITADGTTAVIDLTAHGGGTIRLGNFSVNDLDAEDFQFYETPVDPEVDGI